MNDMEFVKEASYQKDASWKKDIKSEEQPLSVLIEVNKTEVLSVNVIPVDYECESNLCVPLSLKTDR